MTRQEMKHFWLCHEKMAFEGREFGWILIGELGASTSAYLRTKRERKGEGEDNEDKSVYVCLATWAT